MRDTANLLRVYITKQANGWQATLDGAVICKGFSTQALLESHLIRVRGFLPQEIEVPDEN